MIDRLFNATLTFALLTCATLAIGSMWTESTTTRQVIRLPAVEVIAQRALPKTELAALQAADTARSVQ
jgi:hypothetical protein